MDGTTSEVRDTTRRWKVSAVIGVPRVVLAVAKRLRVSCSHKLARWDVSCFWDGPLANGGGCVEVLGPRQGCGRWYVSVVLDTGRLDGRVGVCCEFGCG